MNEKINVKNIFQSPNASRESLELKLKGPIQVDGELIRVEEGVMTIIHRIRAKQKTPCSRCGKSLSIPLDFEGGEWLYYDKKPRSYDDSDEALRIDIHRLEIDLSDPIRQEITLHLTNYPVCDTPCKSFEVSEPGTYKALTGLKDLQFPEDSLK